MILYLDTSALVKRYVVERGTTAVTTLIAQAEVVGTAVITRAETVAAFAKAVRVGALLPDEAHQVVQIFRTDWPFLVRLQTGESLIARADALAWELGLRGYDAVHLAAALIWQEEMGKPVTLATFDRQLWEAARQSGLNPFPTLA
ncbi:MAG: type II toxin-antitoxin system VapC family toxin [Ardenticatenaceae bacterium]|nr:type II toxin-antitoxin system VapC family toxin [Ardenticatenaceae bacterium]MCB8986292.1 type II toxin-antitoxin system VapC family toxin [Ardenticatenaceae bacterium]